MLRFTFATPILVSKLSSFLRLPKGAFRSLEAEEGTGLEEVGVEEAEEVVDWEEAAHEVESEGTPEAAEATKAAAAVCRGAYFLESREAGTAAAETAEAGTAEAETEAEETAVEETADAAVCRGASLLESREAEDWEAEERAVSETKAASWEVETVVA